MKQPELGKKVLSLRLNKGWTQSELAEKCKLSLRTIQRIESMEVLPRAYTIKVILSALDPDFSFSNPISTQEERADLTKKVVDYFKINTMKKISLLVLFIIITAAGFFVFDNTARAQKVEGWSKVGSKPQSYSVGIIEVPERENSKCAFIKSEDENIAGFGTLMQAISAKQYLGTKIKLSAYIKSENVDSWAGLWMRIDTKAPKKTLGFDNMYDRPIKGSIDWKKYEIILDVPENSAWISYGVLIYGTGQLWFDNIQIDILQKIKQNNNPKRVREEPYNTDFEKQ